MKQALLLSVLGIGLLSSCATAFKNGQTPDDVYFSPAREITAVEEEVIPEREKQQYQEYISSMDDRYLRMKVANRNRWGSLDNFDYWNDSRYDFNNYYNGSYYNNLNPYAWNPGWNYGIGYGYRSIYSGYGWNSPVYTLIHYSNPTLPSKGYTTGSGITAYRNKIYNNSNYGFKDPKTGSFIPASNNSSFGSLVRRIFSGSTATNPNASSYDRPARTFQPSQSNTNTQPATSSSAGGSSGGFQSTGTSTSTGRGGKG